MFDSSLNIQKSWSQHYTAIHSTANNIPK